MKHQPVEVVKIVGEKINLTTGVRCPITPHYVAMWKAEKTYCRHEHKTRKAAARCLPAIERLRKNLLAFRRITKNATLALPPSPPSNFNYADGM